MLRKTINMRTFLTVIGILFCLITCNMIGQLDPIDEKETPKEEILVSIESDLPADLDQLADSIANDLREYSFVPDTIHVMYGKHGEVFETFSEYRGANLISSHGDTLFILPVDPGTISDRVKLSIEDAIEIKISEMAKR